MLCELLCVFFFQAEDGIRDLIVTGVQTCALPISVCEKCTWVSIRPGMIHFPAAFTVSASAGTGQAAREPAQPIRPSRITTTASRTGPAPAGATNLAPKNAGARGRTPGAGDTLHRG